MPVSAARLGLIIDLLVLERFCSISDQYISFNVFHDHEVITSRVRTVRGTVSNDSRSRNGNVGRYLRLRSVIFTGHQVLTK
jgi:hypothetical protein